MSNDYTGPRGGDLVDDREWSAEDEAKWQDEADRTCYFCDTVDGHDCDCRLSPFPKCSECHTAFGVKHAETGERVSCECGKEVE